MEKGKQLNSANSRYTISGLFWLYNLVTFQENLNLLCFDYFFIVMCIVQQESVNIEFLVTFFIIIFPLYLW